MQFFLKDSRRQAAAAFGCLATFCLATTIVLASPLELGEQSTGWLPRAPGGKYVGSRCTDDSDCYSANCISDLAFGGDASIFRCRRQEPGGPCFEPNNCGSRQCGTDGRCEFSGTNGKCDVYTDCIGWLNLTTQCVSHRCKLVQGTACSKNVECITGLCKNKVCRARAQAPNAACGINSECLSGKCIDIPYKECTNPDGTFTNCPGVSDKHCARYALGHSCANNGECNEGLCKSGVCTASQDGDSCVSQYQCTGPSICGSNGKCQTPVNGTLAPTTPCDFGAQCVSDRCVSTLPGRDNYNVNTGYNQPQNPPKCDYLNNGESGCTSFVDCRTGVCASGTCRAGLDGDRCQVNYNCVNVCSLDGVCYTPSGQQGQGQPCKDSSQCLSNSCTFAYNSVNRPNLQDGSDFPVGISDTSCAASPLDGACQVDRDCAQGSCKNSVCTLSAIGASCFSSSECTTNNCFYSDPSDGGSGTCQLGGFGNDCSRDDQCFSGKCTYYPGPPYCNGPCPGQSFCDPIAQGGTCRIQSDCQDGFVCDANNTCQPRDITTIQCEADYNCPTGYCVNGFCSPDPPAASGNRSKGPASSTSSTSATVSTSSTRTKSKTTTSTVTSETATKTKSTSKAASTTTKTSTSTKKRETTSTASATSTTA